MPSRWRNRILDLNIAVSLASPSCCGGRFFPTFLDGNRESTLRQALTLELVRACGLTGWITGYKSHLPTVLVEHNPRTKASCHGLWFLR